MPDEITSGWGLTKNNETIDGVQKEIFYASDGTNNIYKVDPDGFTVIETIPVTFSRVL